MKFQIIVDENLSVILDNCRAHVKYYENGNHYVKFVRNYQVIAAYQLSEIIGFHTF